MGEIFSMENPLDLFEAQYLEVLIKSASGKPL